MYRFRTIVSICIIVHMAFSSTGRVQAAPWNNRSTGQTLSSPEATLIVTTDADSGPGSLRQAIIDAPAGSVIRFDISLAGHTILLSSELEISKNLEIDGSGLSSRVTLSGNNAVRIFKIGYIPGTSCNCTITLNSLILQNGKRTGTSYTNFGGAIYVHNSTDLIITNSAFIHNTAYEAGAIHIMGFSNTTILDSEFTSNSSQSEAGAVESRGANNLTLQRSVFTNNSAAYNGGALVLESGGVRTIENNTFANNSAGSAGAITISQSSGSEIYLRNNLFSGNTATTGNGGAISISLSSITPLLYIENNTFYANQAAGKGGAINTSGSSVLTNNTLSDNSADSGGSIYLQAPGSMTLNNNIIANNSSGGECSSYGTVFTQGANNLVEDGSVECKPTLITDPGLSPLANNGGLTQTMAIGSDSPAYDSGGDAFCTATDQRGVIRPQGSHCDIGAFELINYNSRTYIPFVTSTGPGF
jgi:predicted outer membrane repeat protein